MAEYVLDNLELLKEFKNDTSTAIITDIDGTISEIAPIPEDAYVDDSIRKELVNLKEKFKLVGVVSGRSALNAREMVGVEGLLYVGNHGLEFLKDDELHMLPEVKKYLPKIRETCSSLESSDLSRLNGLRFEDKGICFCIHYRLSDDPENARRKILKNLQDDPQCNELKISEGRRIVELKPPVSCDKGTILENIIEEYNLEKVIYLGDDITDLDAFNKLKEMESKGKIRGASILVVSSEIPTYVIRNSSFFVNGVDEVLKFFQWLLN